MAPARWLTRVVCASALVSLGLPCSAARADDPAPPHGPDKLACIAADTDGQALRMNGALRAARRRFTACSVDSCPKMVRDDCLERIRELTKTQPWVIFDATNGRGGVLHEVKVFMDNGLLTERLDGRPIGVEPGEHTFTFRALGRFGGELKLTLREGAWEQHPVVLKTFAPALVAEADAPAASAEAPPPVGLPPPIVAGHVVQVEAPATASGPATSPVPPGEIAQTAPSSEASPRVFDLSSTRGQLEVATLGAGALGIAVGSIFGILTVLKWNEAQKDCGDWPRLCPETAAGRRGQIDASGAFADGVASTVAFAAGGAGLATGAVLWLTERTSAQQTGLHVVPSVATSRGQIVLQGRF
jgi:hypothetical protein